MRSPSYYDFLEISPSASAEVIRAAYRSLSRKYHPDANSDSDDSKHFKRVQEAWEVLSDPESRRQYDAQLERTRRAEESRKRKPQDSAQANTRSRKRRRRDSAKSTIGQLLSELFQKVNPIWLVALAVCFVVPLLFAMGRNYLTDDSPATVKTKPDNLEIISGGGINEAKDTHPTSAVMGTRDESRKNTQTVTGSASKNDVQKSASKSDGYESLKNPPRFKSPKTHGPDTKEPSDATVDVAVAALANGSELDGSPLRFEFTRIGNTSAGLSVNYRLFGTALPGIDFTGSATGTVTFAGGETSTTLSLPVLSDTVIDPGDTVRLRIDPSAEYEIITGNQFATATITAEGVRTNLISISHSYLGRSVTEQRNGFAFAALKEDGSVVTWGNSSKWHGDSNSLARQLSNDVTQIYSTAGAFAALKEDGSVVSWGHYVTGGDSSSVATQLSHDVTQIFSTSSAFAALKEDGSVVTWGRRAGGGNSSSVTTQLSSGVSRVFSNAGDFAALKEDGSVVTWEGGLSSVTAQVSSGVTQIYSTQSAFAALKEDGSVVTWGDATYGGDSSSVTTQLSSGVSRVFSNYTAFAALKEDGSVVTWGRNGGDSSSVTTQLSSGVSRVFSNYTAFAALKEDGSVVTWGLAYKGGDSSSVAAQVSSGVTQIFSTSFAFAALKEDGSVVTWGGAYKAGDSSSVAAQVSSGVTQIYSTFKAFAALKEDGSVVTWGEATWGGDSSSVTPQLSSGVSRVFSNQTAFAALKEDGSVVTWGKSDSGGDSSSVARALSSGVVAFANPFTNDVFDPTSVGRGE